MITTIVSSVLVYRVLQDWWFPQSTVLVVFLAGGTHCSLCRAGAIARYFISREMPRMLWHKSLQTPHSFEGVVAHTAGASPEQGLVASRRRSTWRSTRRDPWVQVHVEAYIPGPQQYVSYRPKTAKKNSSICHCFTHFSGQVYHPYHWLRCIWGIKSHEDTRNMGPWFGNYWGPYSTVGFTQDGRCVKHLLTWPPFRLKHERAAFTLFGRQQN